MRNGVIELLVQSYISLLHVFVIIWAQRVLASLCQSRLAEGFVSLIDIVTTQTFQPRISDNRNSWVAFHRVGFTTKEFPLWHPTMLLVHPNHRTNHITLTIWINQRKQLMHITIGIPQRKDRITIALLHRSNLITLHGRVLSVDILQDIWVDKNMIKSSIEDRALCLCTTLNEDARQVIIPLSTRLSTNGVKVLSTLFGIKVLTSVCHTYE